MKKLAFVTLFALMTIVSSAQTVIVDGVGPDNGASPFATLEAAIDFFKGVGNDGSPNVINITYAQGSATVLIDRQLPTDLNAGTLKANISGISGGLLIEGNPGDASAFPAVIRQNDPPSGNIAGIAIPGPVPNGSGSSVQNASILIQNPGDVTIRNIILYPNGNAPGDGLGGGGIAVLTPGTGVTSNVLLENVIVTGGTVPAPVGYPEGPILAGLPYPVDPYYPSTGPRRWYGPGNLFIGPSNNASDVLNVTARDSDFMVGRSYNDGTVGGVHIWGNNGAIRFEGCNFRSFGATGIWCENPVVATGGTISLPYSGSITLTRSANRRSHISYIGRSSGVEGTGAFTASDGLVVAEVSYTDFYRVDGQSTDTPPRGASLHIADGATIGTVHHCRFLDEARLGVAAGVFIEIDSNTGETTTIYDNTFDDARGVDPGPYYSVNITDQFDAPSKVVFFNNIFTGGDDATDGANPDTFTIAAGATGSVEMLNNVIASTGPETDEYVASPFYNDRSPDVESGTQTADPNYEERSSDREIDNYNEDNGTSPVLRAQTSYTGVGFAGLDILGWNTPDATSVAGVTPSSLDYGQVTFGGSAQLNFDVTASSGGVVVTGFDISGYGASDVSIVSTNLPLAVADSTSEQVTVQFSPMTQLYPFSTPLDVTVKVLSISGNITPPEVHLTGTASPAAAQGNWDMYK